MVLRTVQNEGLLLGLMTIFVVTFAGAVGIMTNAKRAEIFASTAAYAAVLVVFASSPLGSAGDGSHAHEAR